jgi:hypothetical protein
VRSFSTASPRRAWRPCVQGARDRAEAEATARGRHEESESTYATNSGELQIILNGGRRAENGGWSMEDGSWISRDEPSEVGGGGERSAKRTQGSGDIERARLTPVQRVGQQEWALGGHRGRSVAEHEKCANEPEAGRWPGMHNGFWELRLDRRMPTNGHLTTWPDLEEVRRTRDPKGIKRNEPSEARARRSGSRSAKRTQRSVRRDGGRFAKRTPRGGFQEQHTDLKRGACRVEIRRAPGNHPGARAIEKAAESKEKSTVPRSYVQLSRGTQQKRLRGITQMPESDAATRTDLRGSDRTSEPDRGDLFW